MSVPITVASKSRVLLVDDEIALLGVLGTALTDSGYDCIRANTSSDALRFLATTPDIDVIVSDIRMPGMNGIELLKTIRERYEDRKWLQVIFVTGHATIDNTVAALRLEAVDFLHKPVRREQLLAAVERCAQRAKEHRTAANAWQEGRVHLERISEEARRLAEMLMSFPEKMQSAVTPAEISSSKASDDDSPSPERLLELLQTRDIRTRYFTDKLFADPAWYMLLDLMENRLLGRNVSISSLYIVSGVAASTASRRLDEMEESGLIEKWNDPDDGRRQYASLTDRAVELLNSYLFTLHRQLR
ncbi:response regulator [Phyllobacterium calauticae]|jgi:DNA-binding response OmpR family regulator/DNA-binding transcriptional ArsR family regulator|uniref:response regulator n=1 Tax=Phyllobacterium calauticae TaxID=2817027 RepID=UPI001CC196F8|nr:response regulator [Phyllobacterium calauticae]MBZ3691917.1 response regulator [Phyllobacterium calauticae]